MLSKEKARELLRDVQFPGEEDNTYRIAVGGKLRRRTLIRADNDGDRNTAAALEIQRVWRGYCTRRKCASILGRRVRHNGGEISETKSFPLLQRRYREYLQWCFSTLGVSQDSRAVSDFRDYCARVIQLWWRTAKTGGSRTREITNRRYLTKQEAAQKIQNIWRSYQNKKTFKFYQKLIDFKHRGNPAVLLRSINPAEAKLLDKSSGACVRFRLGGTQFPPSIYYKIFTSQAVVDVCSYSPRDYTAMSNRRPQDRDLHNHGGRTLVDDGSNWYRRWENNGWRLISERLFQSPLQDTITLETSAKRQLFHHSKFQRRADVERKKKRKRIDWMKTLYQPGQKEATNTECDELVTDGEIDELLEWTHGLNYDEYVSDWSQIATSMVPPTSCETSCDHNQPITDKSLCH